MSQPTRDSVIRLRRRGRWLAAICLSLELTALSQAQSIVWRPVAESAPPTIIASANTSDTSVSPTLIKTNRPLTPPPLVPRQSESANSVVTIGRPIAIASSLPVAAQPAAQLSHAPIRTTVVRGQSPDLDSGSPYPPPIPGPLPPIEPPAPVNGDNAPYTTQDAARFNAPSVPGIETAVPPISLPQSSDSTSSASTGGVTTAISIGTPQGHSTRNVSATTADIGVIESGTAPPAPIIPHTVAQAPDSVPPPSNSTIPPPDVIPGVATDRPVAPGFWEKCRNFISIGDSGASKGHLCGQSDRGFEGMVSPLTMPFYFEDPRALTEIRPIFLYQNIPSSAANFGGGSAYYIGTQARIAFTERFSVVMSELGYISLDPKNPIDPVRNASGFAEIKIGPKYTFWRDTNTGTLAAVGCNFELPVGGSGVFQNTGSLSVDPYLSFAKSFGQLGGYGGLNFMSTSGVSLSVDNKRSEFFYSNMHLDWNIAKANTFFPFIEMNWFHYISNGTTRNLGTEGADLFNLGSSTRRGRDYFSLAAGYRHRFSEHLQAGAGVEFPVSRERGLSDYRLTFDVIFRY